MLFRSSCSPSGLYFQRSGATSCLRTARMPFKMISLATHSHPCNLRVQNSSWTEHWPFSIIAQTADGSSCRSTSLKGQLVFAMLFHQQIRLRQHPRLALWVITLLSLPLSGRCAAWPLLMPSDELARAACSILQVSLLRVARCIDNSSTLTAVSMVGCFSHPVLYVTNDLSVFFALGYVAKVRRRRHKSTAGGACPACAPNAR